MAADLIDLFDVTLLTVIAETYQFNAKGEQSLAFAHSFWPINNLIVAPLSKTDLYVAAHKKGFDVSYQEIDNFLDRWTTFRCDTIAPHGRGLLEWRLLVAARGTFALVRFGEHPNNGVMCLLREHVDDYEQEFISRLAGVEFNDEHPPERLLTISMVELERLACAELTLRKSEPDSFALQSIASALLKANPDIISSSEEFAAEAFPSLVLHSIANRFHRIFEVTFSSTLRDVYAYYTLTLPSGEELVCEWKDDGELELLATVSGDRVEEIQRILVGRFSDYFDGRTFAAADAYILGTTLECGEDYPTDSSEFWRDLFGFPFSLETTDEAAPRPVSEPVPRPPQPPLTEKRNKKSWLDRLRGR